MNEILQKWIEETARHYLLYEHKSPLNEIMHQCDLKTEMQYHRDIERAYIEGGKNALQNQWISVEEDLPPYNKAVIGMDYMPELAWDDQTIIFVHRSNNPEVVTDKNKFCVYPPSLCKVTHWMEIPSLGGGEKRCI